MPQRSRQSGPRPARPRSARLLALAALFAACGVAAAEDGGLPLGFDNPGFEQGLAGWSAETFGASEAWVEPDAGHAVFSLAGQAAVALLQSSGCIDLPALLAEAGLPHGRHEYRVTVRHRLREGEGQQRARLRTGFAGDLPADAGGCSGPHTGIAASSAPLPPGQQFSEHDRGWMPLDSGPLVMVDIGFARTSSASALLAEVDGLEVRMRTAPVIFGGDGFESPAQAAAGAAW